MQDDRADRDARVERPARQRVEHCAGVRPAPIALELGDDLHRAHLRRTGHGSGREARTQQVEARDPVAQLSRDLGDEVGDVREPLRLEEALDAHAARHAHTREVVAAEVDEHHVLRAVLLGAEQPLGVALARPGRAGDRVEGRACPLALD